MRGAQVVTFADATICIDGERFYGQLTFWKKSSEYFWSFVAEYYQNRELTEVKLNSSAHATQILAVKNAENLGFQLNEDEA